MKINTQTIQVTNAIIFLNVLKLWSKVCLNDPKHAQNSPATFIRATSYMTSCGHTQTHSPCGCVWAVQGWGGPDIMSRCG